MRREPLDNRRGAARLINGTVSHDRRHRHPAPARGEKYVPLPRGSASDRAAAMMPICALGFDSSRRRDHAAALRISSEASRSFLRSTTPAQSLAFRTSPFTQGVHKLRLLRCHFIEARDMHFAGLRQIAGGNLLAEKIAQPRALQPATSAAQSLELARPGGKRGRILRRLRTFHRQPAEMQPGAARSGLPAARSRGFAAAMPLAAIRG